jgi:hypothetical protein
MTFLESLTRKDISNIVRPHQYARWVSFDVSVAILYA